MYRRSKNELKQKMLHLSKNAEFNNKLSKNYANNILIMILNYYIQNLHSWKPYQAKQDQLQSLQHVGCDLKHAEDTNIPII